MILVPIDGSESSLIAAKFAIKLAETFSGVKYIVGCIIDYAIKENIDLIVIGTKGRTGLKRFLMGSVANGVVQHAQCPVLHVR